MDGMSVQEWRLRLRDAESGRIKIGEIKLNILTKKVGVLHKITDRRSRTVKKNYVRNFDEISDSSL